MLSWNPLFFVSNNPVTKICNDKKANDESDKITNGYLHLVNERIYEEIKKHERVKMDIWCCFTEPDMGGNV